MHFVRWMSVYMSGLVDTSIQRTKGTPGALNPLTGCVAASFYEEREKGGMALCCSKNNMSRGGKSTVALRLCAFDVGRWRWPQPL